MAFGSVAQPPNYVDLEGNRRVGNRAEFQDLLQLCQMLNIVHFIGGYPVEPIDLHAFRAPPRRHVRRADPVRQVPPRLQPRPAAQPGLPGAGAHRPRQVDDETLEREPSIFTVDQLVVPAAPRHADAARHDRVLVPQPGRRHDAVHPGRRDGAGDPGRGGGAAERRGAGRHRLHPGGAPGRAGRLRRLHEQRRHAVRRARVRHAGVRAHRDARRPAGPALPPAVPLVQRVRRQRRRRPGRLRERLLALGRGDGRRQPADARRRLDGGRAARQLREAAARRRPAGDGRDAARTGGRRRRHAGARRHRRGRSRWPLLRRRPHPGALPHRLLPSHDQRLAQLRDAGPRPGAPRRPAGPTPWRQSSSPPTSRPAMEPAVREELESFVARRVAEGGVATDF